jgi:DNA primase
MSVKAMAWAWDAAEAYELDTYQAIVLLRLADHANDQGSCWPGKDSLASKCRCSLRKVDAVILQLESMGLLHVDHRSSGGRSMTNLYALNLNQAPLIPPSKSENPAQRAGAHSMQARTAEQETPHTTTENPAQRAPEPSYNHKRTVEQRAGARATAADFDYENWRPDETLLNRIRLSDRDVTVEFIEKERLEFITFAEGNHIPERNLRAKFQSQVHRNWIKARSRETNTGPLQKAMPADLKNVPKDQLEAWSLARDGPRPETGETYDEYRNRIAVHLKNREQDGTISYLQSAAAALTIN